VLGCREIGFVSTFHFFKLKGCRLLGRTFNATEGSDAQQIEVPLSVIEIVDVVDGRDVVMV
jgi:hypothetical protein